MNLTALLSKTKLLCLIGAGAIAVLAVAPPGATVLFESLESKNEHGAPIINQITMYTGGEKDVWIMKQNQSGRHLAPDLWDKLAIVVDKTKRPHTATFYQLANMQSFEPVPYKVRCFICHSNGPRVIRPNMQSKEFPIKFADYIQTFKWNLKIKSYGRVITKSYSEKDPIKFEGAKANEPLKVGLCILCHKDSGLGARGTLTRQNLLPIDFLTKSGHMPPFGLPLTRKTSEELRNFIQGNVED